MVEIDWGQPSPDAAHELTYAERLVVLALRMWAHDRRRWTDVILEFNRVCGPQPASRICQALDDTFRLLGRQARRRVRLHVPVCCRVSPDEVCLLNLLAAVQHAERDHAAAAARWLLPEDHATEIIEPLAVAAQELFACGYELPLRRPEGPDRADHAGDVPALMRIVR